jgi:hypothetical protein
MSPMPGLLHLVVATFREDPPGDAVDAAVARARDLEVAPGVLAVLIGTSEDRLAVATWLPGREALEQFAASTVHMSFIMQGLAPVVRGMWSAAVETEAAPPATRPAHVWAFALPEREGIFEWQMRELLDDLDALPGAAATGPTVEERERFRAGGIVCFDDELSFRAALDALRERRHDLVAGMQDALVTVLPE